MPKHPLRRQIAWEAARLMYRREEAEYYRAKLKAARRCCDTALRPRDLPSNAEIRDQIQVFARMHEGERQREHLRAMRVEALRMMRILADFRPRLIGSTLTGHVRRGSDIDLHVFSDSLAAVTGVLEREGVVFETERLLVRKADQQRHYTHVRIADRFPFELSLYPANEAHVVRTSSVTGKPIERASIRELEDLIGQEYPRLDLDQAVLEAEHAVDRFQVYRGLLLPLERVRQSPKHHPEGDALYHSLQVFDLARDQRPYDEDFLLAALLHDVGKAIDPRDHVAASLEALEDTISERTAWLISHHMEAQSLAEGTLGVRARRRLEESEDFEELELLARCDRQGRCAGVVTPDVDEALEYLQELARSCGE